MIYPFLLISSIIRFSRSGSFRSSVGRISRYSEAKSCSLSFDTEYFTVVSSLSVQSMMPMVGLSTGIVRMGQTGKPSNGSDSILYAVRRELSRMEMSDKTA
jgi:hypothetical protein